MSPGTERVYLAVTPAGLRAALASGHLPADAPAHAVTPALREHYAEGDADDLELSALLDAAASSLRLLAAERAGGPGAPAPTGAPVRRVVLAADAPSAAVRPDPSRDEASAVSLAAPVPLSAVVSAHVDDALAEPDVTAAVDALPAADAGDDDAGFTVDGAEGHDLLWYDATEVEALSAALGG